METGQQSFNFQVWRLPKDGTTQMSINHIKTFASTNYNLKQAE